MKNISKFLILFVLMGMYSCEDFLEVNEVGKTSIPTYFSDLDGIRSAVPGAYSSVYDYYDSEFYLYPQVAGDLLDLVTTAEGVKMVDQYNFTSEPAQEVTAVGHIWSNGLLALANTNNILKYQPELLNKYPDNQSELQQIKAQALFLRALIHFDLVRTYAQNYSFTQDADHIGVPVLLELPGADDNVGRSSVNQVYEQILSDLIEAENIFDTEGMSTNQGLPYFASDVAVKALLSRVYLYMEDWGKSQEYAQLVLSQIELTPHEAYVSMFRTLQPGREAIFILNGTERNSDVQRFYSVAGPAAFASEKLKTMFNDTLDVRLKLFTQNAGEGNMATLKYSRPGVEETSYGSDLHVIRGSEVVLNLAEASANLNQLEEAKSALKLIQSRAYGIPADTIDIEVESKEALLDLITLERAKELCFEGHRFFDITRRHKDLVRSSQTSSSVERLDYPSNLFVLPIPLSEMNTNDNMVQNEGY
ncbi:RagB/SusD family nutrient uptake outer membrane protein [Salegentibacter maritimus]|uniref:RagB/SusD family nutrient uptake outer membrane protein n=1 Tax=Salegentibacter maritimus TaxID=2794347 RepID=A0ABS0TIK1_9FLAO|nr:RagB/SusD family nutrient uptake outer membrane protein [Salegentibacter maritimus]MBI6120890.1 RagB/SusD family nutrient uptake outer membrane protein [Salegentibacter maritimus]